MSSFPNSISVAALAASTKEKGPVAAPKAAATVAAPVAKKPAAAVKAPVAKKLAMKAMKKVKTKFPQTPAPTVSKKQLFASEVAYEYVQN